MYDNARGYAGSTYIAIGYQLQWGKGKTFSIPFPAQCLHVVATYASTKSSDDNSDITVTATSTTGYITHKTYETFFLALGHQPQWGYYTAAVGAIYTDVTTPVSFSKCFIAESIDTLLAASTTWPGTTQTVWNINASNGSKIRFIWSKPPVELDGAVWFGIFI